MRLQSPGWIGTAAVQLAKHMGAEVTGVCSTVNVDMVKHLGADHVIDYKQEDYTKGNQQYDVIFDTVGKSSFSEARKVLRDEGLYMTPVLSMGTLFQMLIGNKFRKRKVIFAATGLAETSVKQKNLDYLIEMVSENKLNIIIDRSYSLQEIREAHAYVSAGHKKGNVLLSIA